MTAREAELQPALNRLKLIDEMLPVMLAYVDAGQRYRYHNRAFREWIGEAAGPIVGRTMLEVLGETVYGEIGSRVAQAMQGQPIRYERTHKTPSGGVQRLFIHLVPHFGDHEAVVGVFALILDQGRRTRSADHAAAAGDGAPTVADAQALYAEMIDINLTGVQNAGEAIRYALKNDEFILYAQPIRDLKDASGRLYEIFLRMHEEEKNIMMQPGDFLPLAEKYGLMGELDRWTVSHVLKMAAASRRVDARREDTAYCVTLSRESIANPYFPDFIQAELGAHEIPGEALRFQLQLGDVEANPADAAHVVRELARLGCWSVLAGFGRDKVDFDLLKEVSVGFLRIDSSIVYRILRDERALATLDSINRVAHTVGINTIAELVESEEMIEKLREVGVDYAQGLAMGRPAPLRELLDLGGA